MFMVVFSGFVANASFIPPWWILLYYVNPISWALQAVAINEFGSGGFYDTPWLSAASNDPTIAALCLGQSLDATGTFLPSFFSFFLP